jgi:hypothetical protein
MNLKTANTFNRKREENDLKHEKCIPKNVCTSMGNKMRHLEAGIGGINTEQNGG